jgi:uncharacterized protein involved in type VI secretion and phage assembly
VRHILTPRLPDELRVAQTPSIKGRFEENVRMAEVSSRIHERLRTRFYGKYRGTVTDVDDPDKRGRIRARVPAVLGDQETGWCLPCVPYAGKNVGFACFPEAGTGVWIEFEGGDVSYPVWTGCWWGSGELPSDAAPDVKVWQTQCGHKLILDDKQQTITISDANGSEVVFDSQGLTLKRGGQTIQV